jgi:c-di-GMP-binding flagellar brake protein YcgR
MSSGLAERREYHRIEFTYPVKFKVFTPNPITQSFAGFLTNMSACGACIQFEDRYGRLDSDSVLESKVKMSIRLTHEDQFILIAMIRWINKDVSEQESSILMGLEFNEVAEWQYDKINQFISMRKNDKKLMWKLWDVNSKDSF